MKQTIEQFDDYIAEEGNEHDATDITDSAQPPKKRTKRGEQREDNGQNTRGTIWKWVLAGSVAAIVLIAAVGMVVWNMVQQFLGL